MRIAPILIPHLQHPSPELWVDTALCAMITHNDSAAIVGAAAGALHGRKRFPPRWIESLSGRTTDRDDGRVFELLEQARARWSTRRD